MLGLFKPRHSILLEFDHITDVVREEMELQVQTVREVYEIVSLPKLVKSIADRKPHGLACITFRNARKSVFLRALPWLLSEEIPFTLMLRPDCIGLNRLPAGEELELYREHFPEALSSDEVASVNRAAWATPEARESFLGDCRKRLGPLPIEKLDPTLYFTTWGKILDIPPALCELGLDIDVDPSHLSVQRGRAFAETQIKRPLHTLRIANGVVEGARLRELRFESAICEKTGKIDKTTDPLQIPIWRMERQGT
jgi:hypothetical protein